MLNGVLRRSPMGRGMLTGQLDLSKLDEKVGDSCRCCPRCASRLLMCCSKGALLAAVGGVRADCSGCAQDFRVAFAGEDTYFNKENAERVRSRPAGRAQPSVTPRPVHLKVQRWLPAWPPQVHLHSSRAVSADMQLLPTPAGLSAGPAQGQRGCWPCCVSRACATRALTGCGPCSCPTKRRLRRT